MVPVAELCKRRRIHTHDIRTPLLVPSLSSKGFPELRWIWDNIKEFLIDTALVSSYDINYGYMPANIETANLLFIDSGCYEARVDYDLSEVYAPAHVPNEWTQERYHETLSRIKTGSAMVVVSFDEWQVKQHVADQIARAGELFGQVPQGAAADLLIKPSHSQFLSIDEIKTSVRLLNSFEIIGVTEKELGDSVVERLTNVAKLRLALTDAGIDNPIHVFGCLDPTNVWLLYLCGADIFDGLSWLRFVFDNGAAIYRNTWSILASHTRTSTSELFLLSLIHNIKYLHAQRMAMARYCDSYDTSLVPLAKDTIRDVLNSAGVTI